MKIKIIATIGPSTYKIPILKLLKKNGMDVGRINMKHASCQEVARVGKRLSDLGIKVLVDIENIDEIYKIAKLDFDYLALSFTESDDQIKKVRKIINPRKIYIIAKIESKKGIDNIDKIIKEADGIMVARGDLGEHVPLKKLPIFQKMIIKKCNKKGKFVITATEMLLSMIKSKVPTRAEVSDVANAVLDGSDALMLSEETAMGKYPAEAVKIMHDIIAEIYKYKRHLKK